MTRSTEDLERALKASEARAEELQAWVDSSGEEAEQLQKRIAELESALESQGAQAGAAKRDDARVAELQAWVDSSEEESDQLRARIAELESKLEGQGSQPQVAKRDDARVAELQAWVDSSEEEAGQLRARIAELEGKLETQGEHASAGADDRRLAELQAWVDAGEQEAEALRARIDSLEQKLATQGTEASVAVNDARLTELQAWVDAGEQEAEQLRARVAELEAVKATPQADDKRIAELQAWVDAAEQEAAQYQARIAELERVKGADLRVAERVQAWVDAQSSKSGAFQGSTPSGAFQGSTPSKVLQGPQAETAELLKRIANLESANQSLADINTQLAEEMEALSNREVDAIAGRLEQARLEGSARRVAELEAALATARETVAKLKVERGLAVAQAQRLAQGDLAGAEHGARQIETLHRAERAETERRLAALEVQLSEKIDEVAILQVRIKAHTAAEEALQVEAHGMRDRACVAEEKLAATQAERDTLLAEKGPLAARCEELEKKLDEAKRWLSAGQEEMADLEKQLEALKVEHAVLQAAAARAPKVQQLPPPPPSDADDEADFTDIEFADEVLADSTQQDLQALQALLEQEKAKLVRLEHFAAIAEASLARMRVELSAARERLTEMAQRLGLSSTDPAETVDRLEALKRELEALAAELASAKTGETLPKASIEPEKPEDVTQAPLAAMEELANQQAQAAREATEALANEQRAREQLLGDLTWLKGELEKLSNVRVDLRHRIMTMVQRELRRKQLMSSLLEKLRTTEVAAAARTGTMRRLQAAMDLAQRTAVRVQTIYFQKQIGSLQRQLQAASSGRKKPRKQPQ